MQSGYSPAASHISPDFSSLDEWQSHFQNQLLSNIAKLDAALDAAFADKNKDHPSQLIYRALWKEFQSIFNDNQSNVSADQLEKHFALLRARMVELTAVYFADNKNEIAKNIPLMKKLGIKDINHVQFDPVVYQQHLSDRKQAFITVLFDTFEMMVMLSRDLKIKPHQELSKVRALMVNPLINEYERCLKHIDNELRKDFSDASIFYSGPDIKIQPTPMDVFGADVQNKEKLQLQMHAELLGKKNEAAAKVSENLAALERDTHDLEVHFNLLSRIENYKQLYAKVQEEISTEPLEKNILNDELRRLSLQRESIFADIKSVDELVKKRKLLSGRLEKERKECDGIYYEITFLNEDQLQQMPIFRELATRRQKLASLVGVLKVAEDLFRELIDRSRKQLTVLGQENEKFMHDYARSCTTYASQVFDCFVALSLVSKAQSINNVLWEQNVIDAIKPFSTLLQELKTGMGDQALLDSFITSQVKDQRECISSALSSNQLVQQNQKADYLKVILAHQETLNNQEASLRDALKQIQTQAFSAHINVAKKEYKNNLDQLYGAVQQLNVANLKTDIKNVTLPDPAALRELYDGQAHQVVSQPSLIESPKQLVVKPYVYQAQLPVSPKVVPDKQTSPVLPVKLVQEAASQPVKPPAASKGFFKRHWKAISGTTTLFMLLGLEVGLSLGFGGTVASAGLGIFTVPVLAAVGAVIGAVVGFSGSCLGCYLDDKLGQRLGRRDAATAVSPPSVAPTHQVVNQVLETNRPVPARIVSLGENQVSESQVINDSDKAISVAGSTMFHQPQQTSLNNAAAYGVGETGLAFNKI